VLKAEVPQVQRLEENVVGPGPHHKAVFFAAHLDELQGPEDLFPTTQARA
jgi:hypothetical protein